MNTFVLAGVIGGWEAAIIILAILILFGGKKIPELMHGLGRGVSEFKKGMREGEQNLNESRKE